ncbi:MAG: DUF817 domain-containing protein [Pseudomonadota bacterium]
MSLLPIEDRLGRLVRRHLPPALSEFVMFGLKQGWACLFGGMLLALLIVTRLVWDPDWALARYDALLIAALVLQGLFLALRLESWAEARVIVLFHVSGTVMEIFKVEMGSWSYPDPGLAKIAGVPLFSGFMYASVGSYMARVIRIFEMRFTGYPPFWWTVLLAAAIYLNFFTHHFILDARWGLVAASLVVFWQCRIRYRPDRMVLQMPLVLAALLSAVFLYLAENIGTLTGTWIYAGQAGFHFASIDKFGSWYLLLYVSFVQVSLVVRDALEPGMQRAT